MSVEKKETQIIYTLIDEVSDNIKKLQDSVDNFNESAGTTEGVDNLTGSMVKANVATLGLVSAFYLVKQGASVMGDILQEGAKLDMMNVSLDRISANMGYTTEEMERYRDSLEEANTYGSLQTEVLKTMLQTGLIPLVENLKFANGKEGFEGLVLTMKDFAASAGVSSGQAIKDFSTAIQRLEPLLLDKYFTMRNLVTVYKEHADAIGKDVNQLSEQEKRQAFLNEIIREGSIQMGVYGDSYATAAKNVISMEDVTRNLKEEVGSALQPAYKTATAQLLLWLKATRDFVKENPKLISQAITIGAVIATTVISFTVATKAVALFQGGMMLARGAVAALTVQMTAAQLAAGVLGIALAAISALAIKNFMDQVKEQKKMDDQAEKTGGSLKDMFANAVDGSGNLNEALTENQEKLAQIQDQIEKENEQFNKQLTQLVDARRDAIEENKKLLEEEKQAYDKKQSELDKKYGDTTKSIEAENQQRLKDLENTLGEELQVGSENYEERKELYMQALEEERLAGEERLQQVKDEYNEETSTLETEYQERTSALQNKIIKDEELLAKHAEVIKTINRDIIRDEIEELQSGHEERLAELQKQLTKEQSAWGSHTTAMGNEWNELIDEMNANNDVTIDLSSINWKGLLAGMFEDVKAIFNVITGGIAMGLAGVGEAMALAVYDAVEEIPLIGSDLLEKMGGRAKIKSNAKYIQDSAMSYFNMESSLDRLGINARGTKYWRGGATLVGEEGAEIVDLPQGSRIHNAQESENMSGSKKNITINNYYPEGTPADMVVSRQMFQLKTLG